MSQHPLFLLAVLCLCVAISEVLARKTWLRHFGTALVVIVVTALVANLGVIPTSGGDIPLYSVLFREIAWMAVFLLVLEVNLREIAAAGWRLITLFAFGALGTAAGAIVGMFAVGGPERLAGVHAVLAGMYTATYVGGSTNFVAIASQYRLEDGALLAAANAVDAGMTTIWMAVCVATPRWFARLRRARASRRGEIAGTVSSPTDFEAAIHEDTEHAHPLDLALVIGLAAFAVWMSDRLAELISSLSGSEVPAILILTTVALVLAQVPAISRLRGKRLVSILGVYLFLAVIGALCDLRSLVASGRTGLTLLVFVVILLAVHGTVTLIAARFLRLGADEAMVASQANIGGGTSALALARSLGRSDLVLPGILLGALGTGLGTYLGVAVVTALS
jgi:uncharacterized membrane protein